MQKEPEYDGSNHTFHVFIHHRPLIHELLFHRWFASNFALCRDWLTVWLLLLRMRLSAKDMLAPDFDLSDTNSLKCESFSCPSSFLWHGVDQQRKIEGPPWISASFALIWVDYWISDSGFHSLNDFGMSIDRVLVWNRKIVKDQRWTGNLRLQLFTRGTREWQDKKKC